MIWTHWFSGAAPLFCSGVSFVKGQGNCMAPLSFDFASLSLLSGFLMTSGRNFQSPRLAQPPQQGQSKLCNICSVCGSELFAVPLHFLCGRGRTGQTEASAVGEGGSTPHGRWGRGTPPPHPTPPPIRCWYPHSALPWGGGNLRAAGSTVSFHGGGAATMFESISEFLPAMHFSVDICEQNKRYWATNDDSL